MPHEREISGMAGKLELPFFHSNKSRWRVLTPASSLDQKKNPCRARARCEVESLEKSDSSSEHTFCHSERSRGCNPGNNSASPGFHLTILRKIIRGVSTALDLRTGMLRAHKSTFEKRGHESKPRFNSGHVEVFRTPVALGHGRFCAR
jgi:hypothetical protein